MGARKRTGARQAAPPRRLSGGHPQVPKADGDAPVRACIEAMPVGKRAVGRQLDALILRTVPDVRRAVRWNTPFYGVEGRGWFLGFHCVTGYVKVAFLRGASLRPLPPVASRHEHVRYVHLLEGEDLDEALLTAWIRQAAAQDGEHHF